MKRIRGLWLTGKSTKMGYQPMTSIAKRNGKREAGPRRKTGTVSARQDGHQSASPDVKTAMLAALQAKRASDAKSEHRKWAVAMCLAPNGTPEPLAGRRLL